jgi:hypothetical protein
VAAPGLAWASEPGLGWFRNAASAFRVVAQGTNTMAFNFTTATQSFAAMYPRTGPGLAQFSLSNAALGAASDNSISVLVDATRGALQMGGTATALPMELLNPLDNINVKTKILALIGNVGQASRVNMIKQASGLENQIFGYTGNNPRWGIALGNSEGETGSDAGSNFALYRFDDAGTTLNASMVIARSNGATSLNAPDVTVRNPFASGSTTITITKQQGNAGTSATVFGKSGSATRWGVVLGDGNNETGGDAGSDFAIYRYNDAGNFLSDPFRIRRFDGLSIFTKVYTNAGSGSDWSTCAHTAAGSFGGGYACIDAGVRGWFYTQNTEAHIQVQRVSDGAGADYFFDPTGGAWKPGGGTWNSTSDERVKQNIRDYTAGLEQVLALAPRVFNYTAATHGDTTKDYVGLIAQEVVPVMPEMVGSLPAASTRFDLPPEITDVLTLDASALTYALVNAIKTLNDRIVALEAA